jgi:Protein of unknown function (DUF4230)
MQAFKKFFLVAIVIAIFAAGIWLGLKIAGVRSRSGIHEEDTVAVVREVQTLSDLVTVKYVIEKVVILDSPPQSMLGQFVQGNNRLLMLAHGTVKAGIDLKRLKPDDVQVDGKTIRIHLPMPQITDSYLDEHRTKVIDWQRGFLRDYDKDLEGTARQNAVDDIARAAREDGILAEAGERAQLELALFLSKAGYEHVEFVDRVAPRPVTAPMPQN